MPMPPSPVVLENRDVTPPRSSFIALVSLVSSSFIVPSLSNEMPTSISVIVPPLPSSMAPPSIERRLDWIERSVPSPVNAADVPAFVSNAVSDLAEL
ncbi:hypothetical protein D3C72_1922010 [compost metagenome]